MTKKGTILAGSVAPLLIATLAVPAAAQDKGDIFVRTGIARTKLVDKGQVYTNGVYNPADAYSTRETFHGQATFGYYVLNGVAVEASLSTPATTNNIPAGALAGLPNLGSDEFVMATAGASFHPFKGVISPYFGGGFQMQFTSQERDGLAVGLNIPNANGPYVQAGIDFSLSPRWGLFIEGRKAWYHTNASGLLPLDATYTRFARVDAKAELDPVTFAIGLTAKFGKSSGSDAGAQPIETDTTRWMVKLGMTALELSDRVDLKVGGAPQPGADLSTYEHHTPTIQFGYFVTKNIAVNATVGLPPRIDVFGGGTIGPLPKLGEVTYGPTAFTLQYHPLRSGRVRPYIGAGLSYMIVFDTKDGAFQNLKVDDDLGFAFEAGTELMVTNKMGIFLDAKKALLRPKAYGSFGGAPVEGRTRLDPWALTGGISFHF